MNRNVKTLISTILVLALVAGFFAAMPTANATEERTIYLKGSGSDFNKSGWTNVFYVGGAESAGDPSVWHLVYSGNYVNAITEMQITFTNDEVFNWIPDMDFSTNSGGNNPGWVIIAPYDWEIAYVNSGNNNESYSFLVTTESGNINFNISGYHKGSPDAEEEITLVGYHIYARMTEVGKNGALTTIVYEVYSNGEQIEVARKVFQVGNSGSGNGVYVSLNVEGYTISVAYWGDNTDISNIGFRNADFTYYRTDKPGPLTRDFQPF